MKLQAEFCSYKLFLCLLLPYFCKNLAGEGVNAHFDKKTLQGIQELELLDEDKRKMLFDLMDTYIRDAKTRQAFAAR